MNSWWTTKKGWVVGSSIVLILIVISLLPAKWVGLGNQNINTTENLPSSPLIKLSELLPPNEDKDGDGIANWRELALGSNPDDKNSVPTNTSAQGLSKEDEAKLYDANNLTTELAKNNLLITRYAESEGALSDEELDALAASVIVETTKKFSYTSYTEKDLARVLAQTSAEEKQVFGNATAKIVGPLIIKYFVGSDLDNLYAIIEEKASSTKASRAFSQKATDFTAVIQKLLAVPTPKDAVETHLRFINALARYRDTMSIFAQANYDPLKTTIVLRQYKEHVATLGTTFLGYRDYFLLHFIVFLPEEPAYMFTNSD